MRQALNYLQIEMLRRLRAMSKSGDSAGTGSTAPGVAISPEGSAGGAEGPEAEAIREVIVLTINGIAAGLRNTG